MSSEAATKPKKKRTYKKRAPNSKKSTRKPKSRALLNKQDVIKVINEQITKEKDRLDITDYGARYISIVTNPFQKDEADDFIYTRIPDGDDYKAFMLCVSGSGTFSGATATSALIQLEAPNQTNSSLLRIAYGNDALNRTNAITAVADISTRESTLFDAMTSSITKYRIIGAGVKVRIQSPIDTSSGKLYPTIVRSMPVTAAGPTYNTYAYAVDNMINLEHMSINDGITVRAPITKKSLEWNTFQTTTYTTDNDLPPLPGALVSGLSATTILGIEFVLFMEIRDAGVPIPVPVTSSPYEEEWDLLLKTVNDPKKFPLYSKGNSFQSFFKNVGKGILKAIRLVGTIGGYANKIASVLV